jgi:predicted RNA-binding protein
MFLPTVYLIDRENPESRSPLSTKVTAIESKNGNIDVSNLFGQHYAIRGSIRNVDFFKSVVVIECESTLHEGTEE